MGIPLRTAERNWTFACTWLKRELSRAGFFHDAEPDWPKFQIILAGSLPAHRTVVEARLAERSGMSEQPSTAKAIFLKALEIPSPEARRAYVVSQCGDDEPLAAEVDDHLFSEDSVRSCRRSR
jgi:hypothetical protein